FERSMLFWITNVCLAGDDTHQSSRWGQEEQVHRVVCRAWNTFAVATEKTLIENMQFYLAYRQTKVFRALLLTMKIVV
ncbi:MAG TPA: hypothetical protein DDZ24_04660, partial [Planctomycetaceae bacterium]|nr:hypothetical protein [Planctomycetaceae bacterium]